MWNWEWWGKWVGNWMWLGAKLGVVVKLGGMWVGNCMGPGVTWEWW